MFVIFVCCGFFCVFRVVYREADVVRVRRYAKIDICVYVCDDL